MSPVSRMTMLAFAGAAALAFANAGPTFAENTVMVGGAPMYPSKNIVQNAMNSKDHTTLVAAVKAAGLVPTLESKGPFTVFAPTNAAFKKLPDGTVVGRIDGADLDMRAVVGGEHRAQVVG